MSNKVGNSEAKGGSTETPEVPLSVPVADSA